MLFHCSSLVLFHFFSMAMIYLVNSCSSSSSFVSASFSFNNICASCSFGLRKSFSLSMRRPKLTSLSSVCIKPQCSASKETRRFAVTLEFKVNPLYLVIISSQTQSHASELMTYYPVLSSLLNTLASISVLAGPAIKSISFLAYNTATGSYKPILHIHTMRIIAWTSL